MKIPLLPSLFRLMVARLYHRELVLLPMLAEGSAAAAAQERRLLPLLYSYRASPQGRVTYRIQDAGQDLVYRLSTMSIDRGRPMPGQLCIEANIASVKRGAVIDVDLLEMSIRLDDQDLPVAQRERIAARKFIAEIELTHGGHRFRRVCSHYLRFENKSIGRDYYFGDDYVDYPGETDVDEALSLLRAHCSSGRLLDVGCALGIYTKAFLDAGFDAHGVDISEFAVTEATRRVGSDRARCANLDQADLPFDPAFDVLWMWDVLEHSADPAALLGKVTRAASDGTLLFLHTSNADSLLHRALGDDWEGYSDYSHHGVRQITATSLAAWLDALDWDVVSWECNHVWVNAADPVQRRLRDAFHYIPELATFLIEHDLGDMLTVVARKRG